MLVAAKSTENGQNRAIGRAKGCREGTYSRLRLALKRLLGTSLERKKGRASRKGKKNGGFLVCV